MESDTQTLPPKRRKMGRPRKPEPGAPTPQSAPIEALPPVARMLPLAEMIRYWRSIPRDVCNSRVIVYAYRILPKLDALQPLSREQLDQIAQKKRSQPETNIGKFTNPDDWDPERCIQQCLERWGAGNYAFYLNDTHPSSKGTKCTGTTKDDDPSLGNFENYPPVLNPKEVLLEWDKNQPYIRWARKNGIKLFGDPDGQAPSSVDEENDNMANVAAIEKLTDALVDATSRRDQAAAPPPPAPSSGADISGLRTALEIIRDGVKIRDEATVRSEDPSQRTKDLIALMQAAHPPQAPAQGGSEVVGLLSQMLASEKDRSIQMLQMERERSKSEKELMERFFTIQIQQMQSRTDSLEKSISELRAAPAKPAETEHAAGGLEGTLVKSLSGAIKEFITEKMAGDGKPDMPWWGTLLQEGLPEVLDTAKNIMANVAAMRAGAPPVAPTTVVEADGEQPGQQIQESPQIAMLRELHGAMIEAMRASRAGFEFGGLIIEQKGEVAYNYIANMGEGGIQSLLQSYAPLWADLMHPTIGPARTQQFIKEFLLAPRAMEAAAAIRLARQQAAQRARMPRPEGGRVVNGQGQPVAQPGKVAEQHQGPVVVKPQ